jgi:hypothetical protein
MKATDQHGNPVRVALRGRPCLSSDRISAFMAGFSSLLIHYVGHAQSPTQSMNGDIRAWVATEGHPYRMASHLDSLTPS